jgi:conjugal transfer pilus assembly protein TraF
MKKLFLGLMILFPLASHAAYMEEHNQGWHWYDDPIWRAPKKIIIPRTPSEQIADLQRKVKESLNLALLDPTESNIKDYIILQNRLVQQSARFASQWQKVIWQHPELNSSLRYPTSDSAKQVYYERHQEKTSTVLHQLSSRYGLFFYFTSHCPYCLKMAPTVKQFSTQYGFEVLPITLDGQGVPEFPEPKRDNGSSLNLKVETVPALFLIDKKTKAITPVGFGAMDFHELEKRIVMLLGEGHD